MAQIQPCYECIVVGSFLPSVVGIWSPFLLPAFPPRDLQLDFVFKLAGFLLCNPFPCFGGVGVGGGVVGGLGCGWGGWGVWVGWWMIVVVGQYLHGIITILLSFLTRLAELRQRPASEDPPSLSSPVSCHFLLGLGKVI